jgi:hypothetical protein
VVAERLDKLEKAPERSLKRVNWSGSLIQK